MTRRSAGLSAMRRRSTRSRAAKLRSGPSSSVGGGEVLHDRDFFVAQIGMAKFRPHLLGLDLIDAGVDRDARDPMLERDLARELRQLLKNLDENHLAKILLCGAPGAMRAHQFEDERIEAAHQFARCRLIMLASRGHQGVGIQILCHVIQAISTLTGMTGLRPSWLQIFLSRRCVAKYSCNRLTDPTSHHAQHMKLRLITLTAISALSLGTIFAQTRQARPAGAIVAVAAIGIIRSIK